MLGYCWHEPERISDFRFEVSEDEEEKEDEEDSTKFATRFMETA